MKSLFLLIATMVSSLIVQASCPVRGPNGSAMVGLSDPFFECSVPCKLAPPTSLHLRPLC